MSTSDFASYYAELEEYEAQVCRLLDPLSESIDVALQHNETQTFLPVVEVATQTVRVDEIPLKTVEALNMSLQLDQLKMQLQISEADSQDLKLRLSERLFDSVRRFQDSITCNITSELQATFMLAELNQLSAELSNIISPSPFQPLKRPSLLDELRAFRERLFPVRE